MEMQETKPNWSQVKINSRLPIKLLNQQHEYLLLRFQIKIKATLTQTQI